MSWITWLKGRGPTGFGAGSTAEEVTSGVDLQGKTLLLTGCASGLGLETLRVLGQRGAHVFALARTEEAAERALASVGASGTPFACDLSEPGSVRACVQGVMEAGRTIDALMACAGVMALPTLQRKYGYELQFLTNHIGHFLLVTGLVEALAPEGRVVIVSSGAHRAAPGGGIQFDNLGGEKGYRPWTAYGQSKLANLLFAKQLARRFAGSKRTANAVHPGVIRTNLNRHMGRAAQWGMDVLTPIFFKSVAQGAATQCYVAVHPAAATQSGLYFADCNPAHPTRLGEDPGLAEKLWVESERIVANLRS